MYKLCNNPKNMKLNYYKVNTEGLKVKPSGIEGKSYSSMTICDTDLCNNYTCHIVNNKLNKIIERILYVLQSDDSTSDGAPIVLDEMAKLKAMLYNKYREFMNREEYKAFLSKMVFIEERFKNDYRRKIIMSTMMPYNIYNNEMTSERNR